MTAANDEDLEALVAMMRTLVRLAIEQRIQRRALVQALVEGGSLDHRVFEVKRAILRAEDRASAQLATMSLGELQSALRGLLADEQG